MRLSTMKVGKDPRQRTAESGGSIKHVLRNSQKPNYMVPKPRKSQSLNFCTIKASNITCSL
jgi:hypothetical protein